MLIDASAAGETRVALVDGNQLIDYDFEDASRRQVKSSIFLAQVTRVEPSLQAAFLEYGAQRQGFLALPEIHPDYYKIPVADRDKLNEALKQSAAEVQAEIDSMAEGNGASDIADAMAEDNLTEAEVAAIDAEQQIMQPSLDPVPLLSNMGRADLVVALSEALGPPPPENFMPVQSFYGTALAAENLEDPDDQVDEDSEETSGDASGETSGQADNAPSGFRGRGRGRFQRREQLDPEAMAAARRRQLLRSYKIQEVIKRRQVMLVQVNKEERGTKGAALTTYISLPGRYCVLMPNSSNAGGVSRKITNAGDRKRMKDLISTLKLPDGMGVILRTAGLECTPEEIARDLDYLLRLWDNIRELTLKSTAPALIYEEGDLITRALRDLYHDDISEVIVSGNAGYEAARSFMQMLLPDHVDRIRLYDGRTPLFSRYHVDDQIDAVHEPVVQLPSGGYIVINQTEALVAIDVNSGRATRERNIEETAYRTNLEAASEVARQLRLRDLAGLIVIDFIDMEDYRHRVGVERRMRDAMKVDRARTQVGRISTFGLLELSRQRLRPSVVDAHFARCETCAGTGWVRSDASAARAVLRAIEQELSKGSLERLTITLHSKLALLLLNQFRMQVIELEERTKTNIMVESDNSLIPPNYRMDKLRGSRGLTAPLPQTSDASPVDPSSVAPNYAPNELFDAQGENFAPAVTTGERNGRRRYRGRGAEAPQNFGNDEVGEEFVAAPAAEREPREGARENSRSRGGRGRGRGRGRGGNNYGENQSQFANSEQPSVAPDAFTHPKQEMWNSPRSAPVAMPAEQPNGFAPSAPAPQTWPANNDAQRPTATPPQNITTEPVVTRVTPEGEADADGSGRKGWWNKLMGA
jgi:ribonuclease E